MTLQPETHTYKTVDNCPIKADVYRPVNESALTAAIIYIHGGCLIYGSRKGINPEQLKLYLNSGYTVISIDYRLAPETKLPAIVTDLQDAFRWVGESGEELFSIDPQRIAAVGHSAGGYLALMSGYCVTPRPKAIVSFYGYGDIIGDWYSQPDPFYCRQSMVSEQESGRHIRGPVVSEHSEFREMGKFYLYCRQQGRWPLEVGGQDPEQHPAFFTPYCPLQNMTGDYPPTLLLHGDQDTDVPFEQSVLVGNELSRHHVKHQLITMNGYGHGFDRTMDDKSVRNAFSNTLSFLAEQLDK